MSHSVLSKYAMCFPITIPLLMLFPLSKMYLPHQLSTWRSPSHSLQLTSFLHDVWPHLPSKEEHPFLPIALTPFDLTDLTLYVSHTLILLANI